MVLTLSAGGSEFRSNALSKSLRTKSSAANCAAAENIFHPAESPCKPCNYWPLRPALFVKGFFGLAYKVAAAHNRARLRGAVAAAGLRAPSPSEWFGDGFRRVGGCSACMPLSAHEQPTHEEREVTTMKQKAIKRGYGVNLEITNRDGPPVAFRGQSISVTYTVTNEGTASSKPAKLRFYLSKNILGTGAKLLGSKNLAALEPGESLSGNASLEIKSSTGIGSYYVVAKLEPAVLTGGDKASFSMEVQTAPDLLFSSHSLSPTSGSSGTWFQLEYTVANDDNAGYANSTYTNVYIKTTCATGGTVVARCTDRAGLNGGDSHTHGPTSIRVIKPPGNYLFVCYAVPATGETNTSNNILCIPFTIT
jgi:hypothetical protein